ncbi:MAG: GTP-binding protein [Thermoleophilia bacterium]
MPARRPRGRQDEPRAPLRREHLQRGLPVDGGRTDRPPRRRRRRSRVGLVFWDLAGVEDWRRLPTSYLRGAAGALLVADGTRAETLEHLLALVRQLPPALADVPLHVLLNKSDLTGEWSLHRSTAELIGGFGLSCSETSARTGADVEDAFAALAAAMLDPGAASGAGA